MSKLVTTPREVLLSFDLDICYAGWDGKSMDAASLCTGIGEYVFTSLLTE